TPRVAGLRVGCGGARRDHRAVGLPLASMGDHHGCEHQRAARCGPTVAPTTDRRPPPGLPASVVDRGGRRARDSRVLLPFRGLAAAGTPPLARNATCGGAVRRSPCHPAAGAIEATG